MAKSTKQIRNRRLLILAGIVVVIVAAIGGVYAIQQMRQAAWADDLREQGMTAYEEGDLEGTIVNLGRYANNASSLDNDVLYRLGVAFQDIEDPDLRELGQARELLSRLYQQDPSYEDTATRLMNLYVVTGRDSQALDIADRLLQTSPDDFDALRAKGVVLTRLNRRGEALQFMDRALDQNPTNLELQMQRLQEQRNTGTPSAELVQQATELQNEYPEDPRFVVLLAYAYLLDNQLDQAQQWLTKAVEVNESPSDVYIQRLVRTLDAAGMFRESIQIIEQQVEKQADSPWRSELVRRLFEQNRYQDVIQQVSFDDETTAADEPELGMMLAISYFESDQPEQAQQVLQQMNADEENVRAQTLASLVDTVYSTDVLGNQVTDAARAVIQVDSNEPYAHYIMGNAREQLSELESAVTAWDEAIRLRPSWGDPRIQKASALLRLNRPHEALSAAVGAHTAQPGSLRAAIALAQARAAVYDLSDPDQARQMMQTIDAIQREVPDEPNTLLLKTRIALETGDRATAREAANRLIHREGQTPSSLLIRLGNLADEAGLQLDADPLELAQSDGGVSPSVTLARARELANNDQIDQGLALIERNLEQASSNQRPQWRIVRARYLSSVDDPRATQTWIELAEDLPENLTVQRAALQDQLVWNNRPFVDRTISRIQRLTGNDAVRWRIHRARYILTGPPAERDPRRAMELLQPVTSNVSDRIKPHLLVAEAQNQLGNPGLASNALARALELRPSNSIRLELAGLFQNIGDYNQARQLLVQVASDSNADPGQRRRAANSLANQGDYTQAIEAIQTADPGSASTRRLLAMLYLRNGDSDQARQMAQSLMSDQNVSAQSIDLAAEVFARTGEIDQAQAAIDRLDQTSINELSQQRISARFAILTGQVDQAIQLLRQVTTESPRDLSAWNQLLGLEVQFGQAQALNQDLSRASQNLPENTSLAAALQHPELMTLATDRSILRPLADALLESTPYTELAIEALTLVQQTRETSDDPVELARQLTELADSSEGFIPLRMVTAKLWLALGDAQRAAEIARSAVSEDPSNPEPAAVAAEALSQLGQWDQALVAAETWRRRAPLYPIPADQLIARSQLNVGRADAAVRTLEPYFQVAQQSPQQFIEVLEVGARALAETGQANRARQLLEPQLDNAARWRGIWVGVVARHIDDSSIARQWLNRVESATPTDAPDERTQLAQYWWNVGQRLDQSDMTEHAYEILSSVIESGEASGQTWFLRGAIAERRQDYANAENDYRQALQQLPNAGVIRNNLAMVLVSRGENLEEAAELARAASEGAPQNPNFLDTLATVQAELGRYEQAQQTIQRAIELDPGNPSWEQTRQRIDTMASAG